MKIDENLKAELKKAILENSIIQTDCVQQKLSEMNKLISIHQNLIEKIEISKNKPILYKVLDEITDQLDEIETSLLEEIQSNRQSLNENEYGEGWMIKSQLYNIAKNAMRLHKVIDEQEDFEDWVQAKLTIADDYLETITHFLEYRKKTVGSFNMDDKDQYNDLGSDEDLSSYNDEIPLL